MTIILSMQDEHFRTTPLEKNVSLSDAYMCVLKIISESCCSTLILVVAISSASVPIH